MRKLLLATTVIIAGFALSSAAMAQSDDGSSDTSAATNEDGGALSANIPDHPRVNEVDQRDQWQQDRINAGVADGQISQSEATADEAKLTAQEATQQSQEAADGGHLTLGEKFKDNVSLDKSSNAIYKQRHEKE